ncbi:hypothetical protein YC2023_051535 [Brassica napus]
MCYDKRVKTKRVSSLIPRKPSFTTNSRGIPPSSVDLLISSFSFAITHLLFLLRWCKEWSLLRFSLLSSPLVAPLRSSAIDIRAVVRRISSLAADDNRCWFICGSMEDEIELLLKDREIKDNHVERAAVNKAVNQTFRPFDHHNWSMRFLGAIKHERTSHITIFSFHENETGGVNYGLDPGPGMTQELT